MDWYTSSRKSAQMTFPNMTCSAPDSPARRLVSLENAEDLTTQEALSFLKSHESVVPKRQGIFYLKTSKAYLVTQKDALTRQSLGFSPTLGMFYNGKFLILKTSESPRIGKECSLSDILEEQVDQKYFLSETQIRRIMKFGLREALTTSSAVKVGTGSLQNDERYLVLGN